MAFGKRSSVLEVSHKEVDRKIEEVYGHEFSAVADQEWGNEESHSMVVRRGVVIDDCDRKRLREFVESGTGQFLLWTLMQDMVNTGKIDEGKYLIHVSW